MLEQEKPPERPGVPEEPPTSENITNFLIRELARVLECSGDEIDPSRPITRYAVDSVEVGRMLGILQRWTGRTLDPDLLWDYPTIPELAAFLSGAGQEES